MSETQFIIWLRGFLAERTSIDIYQMSTLQTMLSQVRSSTNESTNTGKQMLHG